MNQRRVAPVFALAAIAFLIGAIVGANHGSPTHDLARRFVAAWTHRDYATMYSEIDPASQRQTSAGEFAEFYETAATTATLGGARVVGRPRDGASGAVSVAVLASTRLFGQLQSGFSLPIEDGGGEPRIRWSRSLAFPGLHEGERLARHTSLPPRAALLARDGSPLASGAAQSAGRRYSPLGNFATAVVGSIGSIPPSRLPALEAQGVPAGAIVGLSGLERALDDRLRGSPGGQLLAEPAGSNGGARVLASVATRAARPVRSSVSPAVQRAAVGALGGQLGGIVALDPASGQILAMAGIGLDSLQPPGSTFKMVTLTGVLTAHLAHSKSSFPYLTAATLDGVALKNANGESCGGSLALAFATSCNSVFAPLGVKLGAGRLVATAERLGFNHDPGIAGAAESTLPAASEIQGELDVGSTAIGQGRVQASALQMAVVAATIADGGHRPTPSFSAGAGSPRVSRYPAAMSPAVAHTVRRLMTGVVRFGTGRAAAIPGVTVAGKTGTAELKSPDAACTSGSAESKAEAESCESQAGDPQNTDAWFAAFAPALHPRIAVAVLLVADGAGGDTAAPVARQVLEAGLRR